MPEVGEFFVTRTNGWIGEAIRVVTESPVNHAGLYVGGGQIVEAQKDGAILSDWDIYPDAIWSGTELLQGKGEAIADAARGLLGTPYSYWGVACIGIAKISRHHVPDSIRDTLDDKGDLFCSQLVDLAAQLASVQLFDDGRWNGEVAPSDLYDLIEGKP